MACKRSRVRLALAPFVSLAAKKFVNPISITFGIFFWGGKWARYIKQFTERLESFFHENCQPKTTGVDKNRLSTIKTTEELKS